MNVLKILGFILIALIFLTFLVIIATEIFIITEKTTKKQKNVEQWDAYDRYFNKQENITLIRGNEIPNGLYHLACQIIVKHADGTFLLTKRAYSKKNGGKWELSSGGCALKGESPLRAAIRELYEETGIAADSLTELNREINDERNYLLVTFLHNTNCDKNSVILQNEETIAYCWENKEILFSMTNEVTCSLKEIELIKNLNL